MTRKQGHLVSCKGIDSVARNSSNALLSADFSLNYQGVPETPLSLHDGCIHNGVMTSVRRVASA